MLWYNHGNLYAGAAVKGVGLQTRRYVGPYLRALHLRTDELMEEQQMPDSHQTMVPKLAPVVAPLSVPRLAQAGGIAYADVYADELRGLCTAICASDFSPDDRIKSIAQVAYEYLHASSITVYGYNKVTMQLEIIAMPGVSNRELMRGPTDKLIFQWDDGCSDEALDSAWLETDEDYEVFIARLVKGTRWPEHKPKEGDFRKREIEKELGADPGGWHIATAKIHMRKGIGQTFDAVGQAFFNFVVPDGCVVFTPELRRLIVFVSNVIRELLIDKLYHKGLPSAHWNSERIMSLLNTTLSQHAVAKDPSGLRTEAEISRIVVEATKGITENYAGHADVVFMLGARLGYVLRPHGSSAKPRTVLLLRRSVTGTCVSGRRYFVGSDTEFEGSQLATRKDRSARTAEAGTNPGRYPPEFDLSPRMCRSLMVVPIMHEHGVRAVVRAASPYPGVFLDAQARAMQMLEQFACYGMLRLDEHRQRERMKSALDFWMRTPTAAAKEELMVGVLAGLGALWGTCWDIDSDGTIRNGFYFSKDRTVDILRDDNPHGIRHGGFTEALIKWYKEIGPSFFALHVLQGSERCSGGIDSNYYLQILPEPGSDNLASDPSVIEETPREAFDCRKLKEKDLIEARAIGDEERSFGLHQMDLNPSTGSSLHTRIAFVLADQHQPKAVVWVVFPTLHEIAWWEQSYVFGLSRSLGRLLRVDRLDQAIRMFRHHIPDVTLPALRELGRATKSLQGKGTAKRLHSVRDCLYAILMKSAEVKDLLPSGENGESGVSTDPFPVLTLGEATRLAKVTAARFEYPLSAFKVRYGPGVGADSRVSAACVCALFNLLDNAVTHGLRGVAGKPHVCIWIRLDNGWYKIIVGNTGNRLQKDPLLEADSRKGTKSGVGLPSTRDLLRRRGGELRWLDPATIDRELPSALKPCSTFFEFTIPVPREG